MNRRRLSTRFALLPDSAIWPVPIILRHGSVGQLANLPLFWQVGKLPHVAIFLERAILIGAKTPFYKGEPCVERCGSDLGFGSVPVVVLASALVAYEAWRQSQSLPLPAAADIARVDFGINSRAVHPVVCLAADNRRGPGRFFRR